VGSRPMLWSLNHLRRYRIRATDDSLGSVEDVFFDDLRWTVRYLVVDTAWLLGRRVLLPPSVLGHPDADAHEFPVLLTKEQVRNGPDIDAAQPVSRQHEIDLYGYYGWTPYWAAASWAPAVLPPDIGVQEALARNASAESGFGENADAGNSEIGLAVAEPEHRDPHLRSGREMMGYRVRATDEAVGQVEDLLIDEAGWVVRYCVVATGTWLPGRRVLVAPDWVRDISWEQREVAIGLSAEAVRSSPDYNPGEAVGREYEDSLHRHYGRTGYWT
jgi:hypothetical protein